MSYIVVATSVLQVACDKCALLMTDFMWFNLRPWLLQC